MADKDFNIEISTKADTKGAKQAAKGLKDVESAAKQADKSVDGISGDKFAASIKLAQAELGKARETLENFKTQGIDVSVAGAGLDALEADLDSLDPKLEELEKGLKDSGKALNGLKVDSINTAELSKAERELLDLQKQITSTRKRADRAIRIKTGEEDVRKLQVRLARLQNELAKTDKGAKAFRRLSNEIKVVERELRKAEKRKLRIAEDAKRSTVTLESTERALKKVNAELRRTEIGSTRFKKLRKDARALNRELDRGRISSGFLTEGLGRLPGGLGNVAAGFASGGKQAGILAAGIGAVVGAITALNSGISSAANTQQLEVSFDTLLGGIDAAQSRIAELKDFSAKTPFELPAIARASKILETLTKGALSTGKGLETVGNLAASTGEGFESLAVHVGRLYDGLQNGRPVGESLARLQELGIVSAATRSQIELLQKEGKRGDEVWAVAANSFNRFSGEMEKQSKTLKGAFSTLADGIKQALGTSSRPLADDLARGIRNINELLGFSEKSAEKFGDSTISSMGKAAQSVEELERAHRKSQGAAEAAAASSSNFTDNLIDGYSRALDAARGLNAEQEALAREELSLELAEIDAASIKSLEKKFAAIDSSSLSDAGKKAAKAQAAAQSELEKEVAKTEAKRRATNATTIREEKAIQEEIRRTADLRKELVDEQAKEITRLAELQSQNQTDANIGSLGPSLEKAKQTLLVEGRRIQALQAELARPNELGESISRKFEAREELNVAQQRVAAAKTDISNAQERGAELNLTESQLTPEAIEAANERLGKFTEVELAQKQLLESIAEKLVEFDNSGAVANLERKLEQNAKIAETRSKRVTVEASSRLASIQDKSDKVREDSQAEAIEAAAKATKERRENASSQIEQALERLKSSAEEQGSTNVASKIGEALDDLGLGQVDGLESLITSLDRLTNNKEAEQRFAVIREALAELEKEPDNVKLDLPKGKKPAQVEVAEKSEQGAEEKRPEQAKPQEAPEPQKVEVNQRAPEVPEPIVEERPPLPPGAQKVELTQAPSLDPSEGASLQPVADKAADLVASNGQLGAQIVSFYEQVIRGQENSTAQIIGLGRELAGALAASNGRITQISQQVETMQAHIRKGRA